MDRKYFVLIRYLQETASLAVDLANNAARREDVDKETAPSLENLCNAAFHVRTILYHAVGRQMKDDPQERDIQL